MGFVADLFAPDLPKIERPKPNYQIRENTTKLVGRPLSTVYGRARLKGNVVRREVTNDKKRIVEDIALCWGPVNLISSSLRVNEKTPGSLGVDTLLLPGTFTQRLDTSVDPKFRREYNYLRTAMVFIDGRANDDFSTIQDVEVVAERNILWPSGGDDYNVPSIGHTNLRASNPVYAALDWMLNADYGAGRDPGEFDIAQIITEGAYLDEAVPGSTHRFSVNGEFGIGDNETYSDVAQSILSVANASFFQSNGLIKVHVPRAKSAVAVLDRATFEPSGATVRDIMDTPNIVEVVYTDPSSFEDRRVRWENPTSIAEYGEIRVELDMPQIQDRRMASRVASYVGRKGIAEAITIRGEADQRHMNLEPGDVVALTVGDADNTWFVNKLFWVHEVTPENRNGDVDLKLVEYGGDVLFNDSRANTLDTNDPILSHDPTLALPSPQEVPDSPQAMNGVLVALDREGVLFPTVELTWSPAVQPTYMHDQFVIYRRTDLNAAWTEVASVSGSARLYRDTTAEVTLRPYYYAIAARTSQGVESTLPGNGETDITITAARPASVQNVSVTPQRVQTATGIDMVLALSWEDPAQTIETSYKVWYTYAGDSYIFVGETSSLSIQLPGLPAGTYTFKIVAVDQFGIPSTPTLSNFQIDPDNFISLSTVSNVRLMGGGTSFSGRDPEIVWDASFPTSNLTYDAPSYRVYRVRVYDPADDTLLRTEDVVDRIFSYTLEKNREDGLRRQFKIGVTMVGINGQETAEATALFNNPAPGFASNVELRASFENVYLQYTPPSDPDWAGIKVWLSDQQGFTPDDATNLVYDGANTLVVIDGLAQSTDYYLRYSPYDAFGKSGLALSSEFTISTVGLTAPDLPPEFTVDGLLFQPNSPSTNQVSWSAGTIHAFQNGTTQSYAVSGGSATWSTGQLYVYYIDGEGQLRASAAIADATGTDRTILAVYGGGTDLTFGRGDAFFDGSRVIAGTIGAGALVAGSAVITETAQIAIGIIEDAQVKDISFDKAIGSTLASGSVYIGGTEFELDGANQLLLIRDQQSTPQLRVMLGKIGLNNDDYGLVIYDKFGTVVMDTAGVNEARLDVLNMLNGPAEAGADVTGNNAAASIVGQGALATKDLVDFDTDVSNAPIKKLSTNAYAATTAPSGYASAHKTSTLLFEVNNDSSWPHNFGGVVTYWHAGQRATQIFYRDGEDIEYVRYTDPDLYPSWSFWKTREVFSSSDVDVLQAINGPAEANADKTSNNTAADSAQGYGTNLTYNALFERELDGWVILSNRQMPSNSKAATRWNFSNWQGEVWEFYVASPPSTGYLRLYGAAFDNYYPVIAGQRYEGSVYVHYHRMIDARIWIQWFDEAGTSITYTSLDIQDIPGDSRIDRPDQMTRIGGFSVAPAGSTRARLLFGADYDTAGGHSSCYLWVYKPMFAEASAGATKLSPWNEGKQLARRITQANIASYFATAAIDRAFIGELNVDTADIKNLAVDTIKIRDFAISETYYYDDDSVVVNATNGYVPFYVNVPTPGTYLVSGYVHCYNTNANYGIVAGVELFGGNPNGSYQQIAWQHGFGPRVAEGGINWGKSRLSVTVVGQFTTNKTTDRVWMRVVKSVGGSNALYYQTGNLVAQLLKK